MIHLRIVAAPEKGARAHALLAATASVSNLVRLPGVVGQPVGDLILCDVTARDVSSVVADLRDLGVPGTGSIAVQPIDSQIADGSVATESSASASDSVVWEEVDTRTAGMTALSGTFLTLMVLAMFIAMAGILQGNPILIVGAMIVGPDFGPVAGVCVATVERRPRLAGRSLTALLAGFACGIALSALAALALREAGLFPSLLNEAPSRLPQAVALVTGPPGFFTFFVACCAGIAGMVSLSTARAGALIGVLVSVTTVPAAANLALAAAYERWPIAVASAGQLGANIATLLLAGTAWLAVQRGVYARRRQEDRRDPARAAAGLPPDTGLVPPCRVADTYIVIRSSWPRPGDNSRKPATVRRNAHVVTPSGGHHRSICGGRPGDGPRIRRAGL